MNPLAFMLWFDDWDHLRIEWIHPGVPPQVKSEIRGTLIDSVCVDRLSSQEYLGDLRDAVVLKLIELVGVGRLVPHPDGTHYEWTYTGQDCHG